MALEINKVKNTVNTTPTTLNPDAGSGAVSNKPIDLTSNNVEKNTANTEIIKYINSNEFKKLPPNEQFKQLKERFFPNSSLEQVQKYLTEVKQSAAQTLTAEQNSVAAKPETVQVENNLKQTGLEAAIEKSGLKGDIDEVKSQLLLLEKSGKITKEESKILEQLRTSEKQQNNNVLPDYDSEQQIAVIKLVMSEDFRKKPGREKLAVLMDSYLSETDENFANLSEKEKQKYVKSQMKDLMSVLNPGKKSLCQFEEKKIFKDASLLLAASRESGVPIADYKQMSPDQLRQIIKQEGQKQISRFAQLVPPEKLEGKSNLEKIDTYADYFLSISDDKYNSLEGEEKALYRKNKCNEFIEKDLGFKKWSNLPAAQQDKLYKYGVTVLCEMSRNGNSIEDFAKMPLAKQTEFLLNALSAENKAENAEVIKELRAKAELISSIADTGIKNPTEHDIHKKLQELNKQGKLSPEQKIMLDEYNNLKELGVDFKHEHAHAHSNKVKAKTLGCDVNEYIKNSLDGINKDNVNEYKGDIISVARGAVLDKDINQLKFLRDTLKEKGFSDDEIDKLIPAKFYNRFQARGLAHKDGKLVAQAIDSAMATKDDAAKISTSKAVNLSAKYLRGKELVTVGETAVQYESLVKPFSESINNREYITKEAAADVSKQILSSENVPNASKAVFTKEFVTTAAKNGAEEQLYFGKELSEIENPAVTEGLAAASKSVDSSVRSQYDSYVDSAMKNYPPEQQAAIVAARQSGEISKATLAQNTPPTASSNSPETRSAQSQMTDSVSKNEQSVVSQGRTTVSSNPAVAPATSKTVSQTHKTSPSQAVRTDKDAQVMQQKKEALLDKISSYESEKAERIKQRETQKLQKAEKQQEAAIEDETLDTQSVSKTDTTETEELQLSQDEQETLKAVIEDIFQKNSVSAAYAKLLDKIGEAGKDKFLEVFAVKGRDMDVRSFAENYKNNSDTIIKLINYCQSESLKFDLLKMLPSTSISELVSTQKLSPTDFDRLVRENKVESKIILEYINKNKGSMSVQEMKKYLSFLSLADRNALFDILKNTKGSDEWLQAQQENMRTVATDSPEYQEEVAEAAGLNGMNTLPGMDDGISIGSNKVSMRGQYNKMKTRGPFFLNA